jgi:hypothetical protein
VQCCGEETVCQRSRELVVTKIRDSERSADVNVIGPVGERQHAAVGQAVLFSEASQRPSRPMENAVVERPDPEIAFVASQGRYVLLGELVVVTPHALSVPDEYAGLLCAEKNTPGAQGKHGGEVCENGLFWKDLKNLASGRDR